MHDLQTLMLAALLATLPANYTQAAKLDYAQQAAQGNECRYLVCADDAEARELDPVIRYVTCATTLESYLPAIVPVRLPDAPVYRVSLTALGWTVVDWQRVCGVGRNPYTTLRNPLTVRTKWFLVEVTDQTRSDAYLRLLFTGKRMPKTLAQFWPRVGIDPTAQHGLAFGLVEGQSRVNVTRLGARLLRFDDGVHASAWTTFDLREPTAAADPLAALDADFQADGSEVFVLMPKTARGVRGVLPLTVLANGEGELVAEAPVDLVEDRLRTGGLATIRNPMSCIGCHNQGPQRPTVNALESLVTAGVQVLSNDPAAALAAERFHFSDADAALDDWAEQFEAALLAVNGLTPEQNSAAYVQAVADYTADVTLETAAGELFCEPKTLALALGWASATQLDIGPRLAGLPHGFAMPRATWESDFQRAVGILKLWNERN